MMHSVQLLTKHKKYTTGILPPALLVIMGTADGQSHLGMSLFLYSSRSKLVKEHSTSISFL